MHRRQYLVALGGAAIVLVVALFWAGGRIVRQRTEQAIEERFDVRASIGSVGLGLTSIRLSSLVLEGRHGGLSITVDEVEALASPWSVAVRGASSIPAIRVGGVHFGMNAAEGGVESLRAILAKSDGPDASTQRTGGREYEIGGVTVDVRDGSSALLEVSEGSLEKREDALQARAAQIRIGHAPGDTGSFAGIEVSARREELDWKIERALVGTGTIVWGEAASADGSVGLQGRTLEQLLGLARRIRTSEPVGSPSGSGRENENEPSEGFAPTEVDDLPAVAIADGVDSGEAAPERPDDAGEREHVAGLLGRLAPKARLEVRSLSVRTRTDDGERSVLENLHGELIALDAERIRTTAKGRSQTGGALSWDLTVEPAAARLEGNVRFESLPLVLVSPLLPEVPWFEPEEARLDGELEVKSVHTTKLAARGRVELRNAALASPRIAATPVRGIGIEIEGEGAWEPLARRLEIGAARVRMGGAEIKVAGALEWAPSHYLIDLSATLPPTECQGALTAVPSDFLAELSGFGWTGTIGGKIVTRIDSRDLDATQLDIKVADGCRFAQVPEAASLERFRAPFVHRVREPDDTFFEMTTGPGTTEWVPLPTISPFFVHAVLAHEDGAFFKHSGFAPWAIREALIRNLKARRYVLGASTITMQLAKNLFLQREKTLARKVQEAILTWWLENGMQKPELLELYLNVIEYGPSIYGVQSAAWHYFGRHPVELSPAEAVFLACILPAPKLYHGQFERGSLSSSLANRMRRLLRHMHARERIDETALNHGLAEIDSFKFYRGGQGGAAARVVPGGAAPLPYGSMGGIFGDLFDVGFGVPLGDSFGGGGFGDLPERRP